LRIPLGGISQSLLIAGELVVFGLVRYGMSGVVQRVVWAVRFGRLTAAGFVATGVTRNSHLMGYCPV
jgi:hypothetical protein